MSCTFQLAKAPEHLLQALHEVIPQCELQAQQLPETPYFIMVNTASFSYWPPR